VSKVEHVTWFKLTFKRMIHNFCPNVWKSNISDDFVT